MTAKIGLNVHHKMRGKDSPRDYSAEEKTALWSFFEQLRPATSLFMELDWARQAKRLVPECAVVYRPEGDTDLRKETPQQFYNFHAPSCDGGQIILNVLNEPSGFVDKDNPDNLKQLAHWCAEVMDLFGKAGLPVVIPNFGVGNPDLTRLDHFRELWNGLVEWSNLHYFGYHPYWSYKGLDPLDGRLMRWKTMLAYIGSPNVKVIGTETGSDDLLDGSGKRGYKDYWTGDGYATISIEAIEKHFNHPQFVGGCWYCYGNTGGDRVDPFRPGIGQDWWTFDFSADDDFKRIVMDYAKEATTPETPAPVPSEPVLGEYNLIRLIDNSSHINLRVAPNATSEDKGDVLNGDVVFVYPDSKQTVNNYTWVKVDHWRGTSKRLEAVYMAVLPGVKWLKTEKPEAPPAPISLFTLDEQLALLAIWKQRADLKRQEDSIYAAAETRRAA